MNDDHCEAITKSGTRCMNPVVPGTRYCRLPSHQIQAAAQPAITSEEEPKTTTVPEREIKSDKIEKPVQPEKEPPSKEPITKKKENQMSIQMIALGMIEKRYHKHISFFEWFRFGIVIGIITCIIACCAIIMIIIF